jgi:tetratricopeptide (TPR) repeat protein
MKRIVIAGLIVLGISLIATVVSAWLAPDLLTQPGGLAAIFGVVFVAVSALFGGKLSEWADTIFEKKSEPAAPSTRVVAMDEAQVNTGESGRNVRAEMYIEKQVIEQPAPLPEVHDTIGFVPPFKGETYIHRGKIEDEVREFLKKGGTGAIVGLHAPGGLGKTELAKHAAEDLKGNFDGGVLWIDVGDKKPHQVVGDMLMKCGVQTQPGATYEQQRNELQHALQEHCFLIVLDDVREDALAGLADYLPPKPCSALVTSRIKDIGGVQKTFPLGHLTDTQAKDLLNAVLGEDVVNAEQETADKLAERCAFNPLALEIAARRIRQLQGIRKPMARYLEMAQARFGQLKMEGDARWNMETVFDLSYNDLSLADQKRFRTLAVFAPTGFAPAAAAHLWQLDEGGAGEVVSRFINLSLVIPVESELERYRLHDLLDEYADGKLGKDKEEEKQAHLALAEWLVALFDEHYTEDRTTAPEAAEERINLLKACEWTRGQKDAETLALLVTKSRNWFYVSFTEDWIYWIAWLEAAYKLGISDLQLKANVLQAIGDVQQFRDDRDAALESYNEALKLFRQVGAKLGEANVYLSLGGAKRTDKNYEGARMDFQNAFDIYCMIGDQYSQGRALYRLGDCLSDEEKYKEAITQYEKAIQLWMAIGITDLVESILKPRIEEAKKHL